MSILFKKKLLLLPEMLLKELLNDFGKPDGDNWFTKLGDSIDYYYKEHKSVKFTYVSPRENPGTSLHALKRSLGYDPSSGELKPEKATGVNIYIREVLAKKYGNNLNWTEYLKKLGLSEDSLLPMATNDSHAERIKQNKNRSIIIENQDIISASYEIIRGYWLSRFEYVSKNGNSSKEGYQIDIERLDMIDANNFSGQNLAIVSPYGKPYKHQLVIRLFWDFLVGYWKNTNTKNIGAFQLFLNTNMCIMTGRHLGNAGDNTIQHGVWTWIKIADQVSDITDKQIINANLKHPQELTDLMKKWESLGETIHLSDVLI